MTTRQRDRIVETVLDAACREVVRQVRAGETTYVVVLVAATQTAELVMAA